MTAVVLRMTAVVVGATILAAPANAQTTDVALGIEALSRRDLNAAEKAFRRGTTAENPLIRPAAWQWLGHVAWKFRGDTTAARRYLDRALLDARDSSQILLEIARLNGARRRYRDAVTVAFDAMSRSGDGERRGLAARTLVELAVSGALAGRTLIADSVDLRVLSVVRDTLAGRVSRFQGRTSDALALIHAATMVNDTTRIRLGLRSYFALIDRHLQPLANEITSAEIDTALMRGQLFEALALRVRTIEVDGAPNSVVDAVRYAEWSHDLRRAIEAVYRAETRGAARPGDVTRTVNAQGARLWKALVWPNHRAPDYYPAALRRELARRLGAALSIERSRGMDELYLGHSLGSYAVNGATMVVLDANVMSGIDDWFLDGTGGRAGWVADDTVYMRRTAFTETPFRALLALTDPQTMPGELFRITRDSIGDVDRARGDSLGYFPGVAARVFRSGAQALLDSVKTPDAFTRAMFENLTRTSIELHESRHRADVRSASASTQAEAEFRAKLDEVTGAPLPRLALTAILSPTIGDGSPHGQANRRIMIGLNRWIRRNGGSIAGYDARTPALLQLPLLTDAQLRAAFQSMRSR
jgi:hypothetical protein